MSSPEPIDLFGLSASQFGKDFTWGVATAAYQIEGAWNIDGKGPSIWDTFSHRKRRPIPTVARGETGDTACDFYHRYGGDIQSIADLGFKANRFSISWPRVLPTGTGSPNPKGLDFYSRVVDATLEADMEPWPTLYHWDLPQALQDRGGWANRDVVGWFEDYTGIMADRLGDRVKTWMVFNEPASFCPMGYLFGIHAPGIMSRSQFMGAVHHVNLCQAAGARVLRNRVKGAVVGTTHIITPSDPIGTGAIAKRAAQAVDAIFHRTHIEPNLGLGYPMEASRVVCHVEPFLKTGDDEAIKVDFDFFGLQYYTKTHAIPLPFLGGIPLPKRPVKGEPNTMTGFAVIPDGFGEALAKIHAYGRFKKIIVTENGISLNDKAVNGRVRDERRIDYLRLHLQQIAKARAAGIPVEGYLYWSFLDNFEWTFGYGPRFGLVHINFETQERTVKDSARWFKAFLKT